MSIDLEAFLAAEKTLIAQPDWIIQNSEWLGFTCPIDIDDITIVGFRLRAKSKLRHQDRQCGFANGTSPSYRQRGRNLSHGMAAVQWPQQ